MAAPSLVQAERDDIAELRSDRRALTKIRNIYDFAIVDFSSWPIPRAYTAQPDSLASRLHPFHPGS